jgi:hypothetical protein
VKLTSKNIADQVHDEHDAYVLLEELLEGPARLWSSPS